VRRVDMGWGTTQPQSRRKHQTGSSFADLALGVTAADPTVDLLGAARSCQEIALYKEGPRCGIPIV